MNKKFSIIVCDPPWSFADSLKMSDVPRGAAANYNTMSNSDILGLDVKSVADPNGCVLALWVPSTLLQLGLDTMKAWGFEHKQTYVWVKTKKEPLNKLAISLKKIVKQFDTVKINGGFKHIFSTAVNLFNLNDTLSFFMGRLFRQTHEICLIGINNKKIYKKLKNKSQRSVSFGENLKHSAKPVHLQKSLETMFPDTDKLEMFARRQLDGWCCVGNEAPMTHDESIMVSLQKLTNISSPDYNNIMSFCHDQQKLFEMWKKLV